MAEAKLGRQPVASTVLSRLDSVSAIPASLASLSLGFSARKRRRGIQLSASARRRREHSSGVISTEGKSGRRRPRVAQSALAARTPPPRSSPVPMTTRLAAIQGRTACVTSGSVYFRVLAPGRVVPFSLYGEIPPLQCPLFCLPLLPPSPVGTGLSRPSAQPRPGLPSHSPPRNVISGPIVSGSPLAPGYRSQAPATARSGESPPGPVRRRPRLFLASLGRASSGAVAG